MVDSLLWSKLADWRKDAKGVAGEEHNVLGVAGDGGDLGVVNKLQRIRRPRVLRNGRIKEIYFLRIVIQRHILQHRPKPYRIIYLRLFLLTQANAFGVTSTLNVEHTLVCPNVLVVAN